METSLHRQLKSLYADEGARFEVPVGGFRIDVVTGDQLVEIQHGSLAAMRNKVQQLLKNHRVLIVKPIVAGKLLVKQAAKGGPVQARRMSPKRGRVLDLFDEMVYFTRVFPHPRLTIDVPLVDIEEWRYPGHGRRRRWRASDYLIEDQRLIAVRQVHRLQTPSDVRQLIPSPLPRPFHTGHLAERLAVPRWVAQRIAYCLRNIGVIDRMGKERNAWLYEFRKAA